MHEPTALVLANLGTPSSVKLNSVRAFLAHFLMDPYVIQAPWILRMMLVYGVILPFRVRSTRHAYEAIWDPIKGSPLLYHSESLRDQVSHYLNQHFPDQYHVKLAMRYDKGELSFKKTLAQLKKEAIKKIIFLPLYPQYAVSTTESSIQLFLKEARKLGLNDVKTVSDFYEHPAFIQAIASIIEPFLASQNIEYLLFSYHGLPQEHVKNTGCNNCAPNVTCPAISSSNRWCYRAQCFATTRALVKILGLKEKAYGISFQSRLGRLPWIGPYTDEIIQDLAAKGIRHLAVVCPSFVTDCLETKEEIELRLRDSWFNLVDPQAGATFTFIPCLNDHSQWVAGIEQIIHTK